MDDDLLEPRPPVGVTRGLIRQRDKMHVGTIWMNRTIDVEATHRQPVPVDGVPGWGDDGGRSRRAA